MSHPAQRNFIRKVLFTHPQHFINRRVVDIGSMDINGTNRPFFFWCDYTGIDIMDGPNVDIVAPAHRVLPNIQPVDTIISTEALEHDEYWQQTLLTAYHALKPGGLLIITCAGEGRPEHGTHECDGWCSPATNDYYCNVTNEMLGSILTPGMFSKYYLRQHKTDLQFYGVKKS